MQYSKKRRSAVKLVLFSPRTVLSCDSLVPARVGDRALRHHKLGVVLEERSVAFDSRGLHARDDGIAVRALSRALRRAATCSQLAGSRCRDRKLLLSLRGLDLDYPRSFHGIVTMTPSPWARRVCETNYARTHDRDISQRKKCLSLRNW